MQLIGSNDVIDKKYKNPTNIDSNDVNYNLRDKLNIMDSLITPVPVLIDTNSVTLNTSYFGKVILFNGDNTATRFDLTLPTIGNGDSGKRITVVGASGLYSGRIIAASGQNINNRPYLEIGSFYTLVLTAIEDPDGSKYYSIYSSSSSLNIWEARQDTQALPHDVLTKLKLDEIVLDPDNCWDAVLGQTNLAYAPGYYNVICEVTIHAIDADSHASLYPYRNGVQAGDPVIIIVPSEQVEAVIYQYTGYFNGLGLTPLDFRIIQTTVDSSAAEITLANISGNFISLGP